MSITSEESSAFVMFEARKSVYENTRTSVSGFRSGTIKQKKTIIS